MTLVNTLEDSLQTQSFFSPQQGVVRTCLVVRGYAASDAPFCPALPHVLTLSQSSMVLASVLWNVESDAELNLS